MILGRRIRYICLNITILLWTSARISEIVNGKRIISADTALRLGRYFSVIPETWLGLQIDYDLRVARKAFGAEVERRIQPVAA